MTFIDIESVHQEKQFELTEFFIKKFQKEIMDKNGHIPKDMFDEIMRGYWNEKAALYAEFGKIVCISIGYISGDKLKIKTLYNRDEKILLQQFSEIIIKVKGGLCAHNGKEFDFPYLMRRFIINELVVPDVLNPQGKKPYEVDLEDTMKMWSGTAWNYKVSLSLLAHVLGLPNPKQEMDGSKVSELYYAQSNDKLPFDLEEEARVKISSYCAGDVATLANVWLRLKGMPIITNIEYVGEQPTLFS